MIRWKPLQTTDLPFIHQVLEAAARQGSEYTLCRLFDAAVQPVSLEDPAAFRLLGISEAVPDTFTIRFGKEDAYLFPAGRHSRALTDELLQNGGEDLTLRGLTDFDARLAEYWFPGAFAFAEETGAADACCHIEYLAAMDGSRYEALRGSLGALDRIFPSRHLAVQPDGQQPGVWALTLCAEGADGSIQLASGRAELRPAAETAFLLDLHSVPMQRQAADPQPIRGAEADLIRRAAACILENHPGFSYIDLGPASGFTGLQSRPADYFPDMTIRKIIARRASGR